MRARKREDEAGEMRASRVKLRPFNGEAAVFPAYFHYIEISSKMILQAPMSSDKGRERGTSYSEEWPL